MEERFIPRDISWLDFNGRVLAEAGDPNVPLFERIKFLAIFSSNLDEFFRVRVSALRQFKKLRKKTKEQLHVKPKKVLKQVMEVIQSQQVRFGEIFFDEIIPELERHNIFIKKNEDYNAEDKESAKKIFQEKIAPHIHLQSLSDDFPIPFLDNRRIYFILDVEEQQQPLLFALPDSEISRFILLHDLDDSYTISFLDDIIRANLQDFLDGQNIREIISIKLSRDAEMYIDDEFSGDLLDKIKKGISERNFGLPTRFLYDHNTSVELLDQISQLFNLSKQDLVKGGRYHNFHDLFGFPKPEHSAPELSYPDTEAPANPDIERWGSVMDAINNQDILLHFPYDRFSYIPEFIEECADREDVTAIKITLYRIGSASRLTEALQKAARNGKSVLVFIEAKARFDEASNMYWGQQLQDAGAKVIYSFPQIKVHAKILQVSYLDGTKHSYIGTGNFNEKNAKIYTDFALLSADPVIGRDIEQVFNILEGKLIVPNHKKIKIAPFALRNFIESSISRERLNALEGKEASIIAKLNNLEDYNLVQQLLSAAEAGVKIKLLVRGICCLNADAHPNIELRRVVDRFLEHARLYYFHNCGEDQIYISSADWMSRNLDRRIEVACPIIQQEHKDLLMDVFYKQWNDQVKGGPHFEDMSIRQYHRGESSQELLFKSSLART